MIKDLYPTRCTGEPQLFARSGAVARREWQPGAPLTAEQIAQFDRDGYLVLEDVFSEAEMAMLQAETGRLLGSPEGLEDETVIAEPGSREVRSIFAFTNRATRSPGSPPTHVWPMSRATCSTTRSTSISHG